ncbi:sensor histidine kinase KdpD [Flavobacterium antarcticum]|uniref:sensor histidine kinase n=1 Tax=Flavobacterium antarcticum TaxID=271155 RepID=UPI0003B4EBCC|nr:HAMP domain-containing sensor histidine kinase [Flavobacterium antarcticum]
MKSKNYKYILTLITLTVFATIGLQIFWNIKNYRENKSQLIKEVQTAFDNSIEYYYVEDSKNDFMAFIGDESENIDEDFFDKIKLDTVFEKIKKSKFDVNTGARTNNSDSLKYKTDGIKITSIEIKSDHKTDLKSADLDSSKSDVSNLLLQTKNFLNGKPDKIKSIKVLKGKKATDSISKLKNLVNKVIFSVVKDSIEFKKVSIALDKELVRKNINVVYSFQHFKADTLFAEFRNNKKADLPLSAVSGSTYLPSEQKLQISFSDPTILLLKRSITKIILSLLLSLSIIFCLLYLLRTINKQKKIDEIKNDLISNITHEFKTPITTISTAIEGIKNFNAIDDKEKTNRYLDISTQQLNKLAIMVEKLLETASLNTDQLILNKEQLNIVELIKSNIEKHQMASEKKIHFTSNQEIINCEVDAFHFENAISNLLDNAIKYGGSNISIDLIQSAKQLEIAVEDNGMGIDKTQQEKIFDQFYRIPKGNIHDVKGFGIGLFYAKKIIEKHGGTLELVPNLSTTTFKITLNNAN